MCDSSDIDETYKNPNHKSSLLYGLYTLYQRKRLCDVQIIVNARRFQAHGVVLASSSEFFSMKIKELSEESTATMDIFLDGVDDEATSNLIDYFYVGELKLRKNTVLHIISAAGLFQLNSVIEACCKFMEKVIDPANCLSFSEIGELQGCADLHQKANEFITQNITKIANTEEFKKITQRQLENLLKMNLNVTVENDVFEWVKTWVNYDLAGRKDHLVSLLKLVRLPELPLKTLIDQVRPLCDGETDCQNLIFQALRMKDLSDKSNSPSEYWNVPRTLSSTVMLAGSLRKETTKSILIYDPQRDSWKEYLNTGIERRNACYALVGDELFIIGGQDDSSIVNTVETVNLKTGKKTRIASLQQARFCAVAGVFHGKVYVFGGTDGPTTLESVEKWDPQNPRWSYSTPMITGREGCGIGILNNEMYIVGGWNRQTNVSDYGVTTVEAFCPITGKWRVCSPLFDRRHWVSAAVANGKLYVVGGRERGDVNFENYRSIEVYDHKSDKWSYAPNMSMGRYGVAPGSLGSELIVVGGASRGNDLNVVERLDSSQNKMVRMNSMPQNRENSVMFSVPIDWLKRNVTLN